MQKERRTGLRMGVIIILVAMIVATVTSCIDQPDYGKDPHDIYGNFDALADIVGSHYCYFEEKGVDWDALCREYRAKIFQV